MKNKSLIVIICLFCSLFFIEKANAKEISHFCDYTEPCLTTEKVDELIKKYNIDTSIYDTYLITVAPNSSTYNSFKILLFNYKSHLDGLIYVTENTNNTFLQFGSSFYYFGNSFEINKKIGLSSITLMKHNSWSNMAIKGTNANLGITNGYLVYYTNKDILDKEGNVVLKANTEIEEEPEEPITIINKMALFVKDIVIYFNENNISFYQILIGLFVFNFLVYVICYIVRRF